MPPSALAGLFAPKLYLRKLAELEARWRERRRLDRVTSGGLSLLDLGARGPELVSEIVRAVRRDEYELGPLHEVEARVEGKRRTLYLPNLTDALVLAVLADRLAAILEPSLSPHLYSYRRGRSSWQALRGLQGFLAEHRARLPVRERGLYGLHRDVARYGESIPTGRGAPIHEKVERLLAPHRAETEAPVFERLLKAAIRPRVVRDGARSHRLKRGLPTGSPIQPALCNLYLAGLDQELERLPGAFYARFGDDILFLHPDAAVVQSASELVDRELARLGLTTKPEKRRDFYLNGCGRSGAAWPTARAGTDLEYLGARVAFTGNIGLKREKLRRLLGRLRRRLRNTAVLLRAESREERARTLCAVVEVALDPTSPLAEPTTMLLHFVLDDRRGLRQVDHLIALAVAELVAGRRGPRAFRQAPPRWLRALGLPSLEDRRNTMGGKARTAPHTTPPVTDDPSIHGSYRDLSTDDDGGDP
ncbi:MAG: group II intron reverse transcriptase domain-containing protein [Polyangiaceae bacterium]|nr:group II intron reverse transcriptase domain-containing protein [Polyangiaceae bacterium]